MNQATTIPISKRAYCGNCGIEVWKSKTSASNQRCRSCRQKELVHGRSGYRRGCRCRTCRDGVAAAAREYTKKLKLQGRRVSRGGIPSSCTWCGKDFLARRDNVSSGGGEHCSIRCSNFTKAVNRGYSIRPPRKSQFRKRAERIAERANIGSDGGKAVWVQGPCIICATQFLSRGEKSRYCSHECRQKNRARLHGLNWLDRMAIFERDNWTCHLCGSSVDYSADASNAAYPTLDHIIPRSKGGTDDVSNLATCHSLCNSIRRDLPIEAMRTGGYRQLLRERLASSQ